MVILKNIGFCEIPCDWNDISLGDKDKKPLLEMRNGLTKEQHNDYGIAKISRIETISKGVIDETRVKFLSNVSNEEREKYLIRKGDILFSNINSEKHLGKTAIAEKDYDDLLHGMNLLLFRANQDILVPEFLFFVLNYYKEIGVFKSICGRAVNQASINQGKLKALRVPAPIISEQQKITYVLSTIQLAIEMQERIIRTTTDLKKALMQKLFAEGLQGEKQKQTEIGLVPESWEVVELGDICEQLKEAVLPVTNGKIKYVGLEHIQPGKFQLNSYGNESVVRSTKYKFYPKDVLYGKLRPYLDKAVLVDCSGICSTDIIVLRGTPKLLPNYLIGLLHTNDFITYSKKTTSGVNHPRTSWNFLKQYKLGLPKISEQEEIGLVFQQLENMIENHQDKMNLLKSLFESMLHQLMTGRIRVKDLKIA